MFFFCFIPQQTDASVFTQACQRLEALQPPFSFFSGNN
jgi:hypothetical protein